MDNIYCRWNSGVVGIDYYSSSSYIESQCALINLIPRMMDMYTDVQRGCDRDMQGAMPLTPQIDRSHHSSIYALPSKIHTVEADFSRPTLLLLLQVARTCSAVKRTAVTYIDNGVLRDVTDPGFSTAPVRTGCGVPRDGYLTLTGIRTRTASVDMGTAGMSAHALAA